MDAIKNILVIGSNGSIGFPLCSYLERIGYNCIRTSRNDSDKNSLFMDLTNLDSIDKMEKDLPNLFGIIFLGGKEPSHNLESMDRDHLDSMIDIHFRGVIWAIKKLRKKIINGGFIITTSSVSSHKGSYDPAYSSLKSAIEGLTRTLVRDLSPQIRINSVAPGLIENNFILYHVVHSVNQENVGVGMENWLPIKNMVEKDIIDQCKNYYPVLDDMTLIDSLITTRIVLPEQEIDDARPTLVLKNTDKIITVFSGKITTCVDAANKILKTITDGKN